MLDERPGRPVPGPCTHPDYLPLVGSQAGFSAVDSPASAGCLHPQDETGLMGGGEGAWDLPSPGDPALTPARSQTFLLSTIQRLRKPKSKFLSEQIVVKNALYVAVTETLLNSSVLDAEMSHDFSEYNL